jgi:hypothetical protein
MKIDITIDFFFDGLSSLALTSVSVVGGWCRGCFCKRYIGGANNLREADVIVMSSGVTKLFQFILYFLSIKTSFIHSRVQVSIKKYNFLSFVLECRFLLRNTFFYRLLQHNLQYNTTKLNLGTTTEKQDATECTNS